MLGLRTVASMEVSQKRVGLYGIGKHVIAKPLVPASVDTDWAALKRHGFVSRSNAPSTVFAKDSASHSRSVPGLLQKVS
jgi:hypothetical protein